MKFIRLLLPFAGLAIALPAAATLEPFQPGQDYNWNGTTIPSQQTLSPAGHPDIAFRPSCGQLGEVLQANGLTAYTVNLPDGNVRILEEMPPRPRTDAEFDLDAAGLCKIGGVNVPIVFASQLPEPAVVAPEVAPVEVAATGAEAAPEPSTGINRWQVVVGLFCLGAAGLILLSVLGKARRQKPDQSQQSVQQQLEAFASLAREVRDDS
jgi:hypothetical protein